ncbi:hypothetical protein BDU57DRAFT_514636 [Ampelomyces quisqualis]|uniref:Secreted protein n=1 Tax=Ampelomyces quisqualis TaxID=50730 RepID=A0A6A5QU12_AMPQU|nr:hypothetical protein BDU57DRAFT_514636 [Ampelomyces quisqualis]
MLFSCILSLTALATIATAYSVQFYTHSSGTVEILDEYRDSECQQIRWPSGYAAELVYFVNFRNTASLGFPIPTKIVVYSDAKCREGGKEVKPSVLLLWYRKGRKLEEMVGSFELH